MPMRQIFPISSRSPRSVTKKGSRQESVPRKNPGVVSKPKKRAVVPYKGCKVKPAAKEETTTVTTTVTKTVTVKKSVSKS